MRSECEEFDLMGVLKTVLENHVEDAAFVPECAEFFARHTEVLEDIVMKTKGGQIITNVVQAAFEEVGQALNDPDRGVKLVIDTGMPMNKYQQLSELNQFKNPDTGEWEALKVCGATFPNIHPSFGKVKERYKFYKDQFNIEPVQCFDEDGTSNHAAHWQLDQWLEYIVTSPFYSGFIPRKTGQEPVYEVIIREDGLKMLKHKSCFLLATLGNFGIFSKCVLFNSIVNFAQVSEKETAKIRQTFR